MALVWSFVRQGLKKQKHIVIVCLILASVSQVFSLLDPLLFQFAIDNYALQFDSLGLREFLTGVSLIVLGMVGVAFVSRLSKVLKDHYVEVLTQRVGTFVYARSVSSVLHLPFSVFEDRQSGEVLQKIQKAREDLQLFVKAFVDQLFLPVVGVLFVLGYGFYLHPYIGFAFGILIPIIGVATYYISGAIKKAQSAIVTKRGVLAGDTTESLRNIELVKSLGLEEQEIKRLNSTNDSVYSLEVNKSKVLQRLLFIKGTLVNASRSILLVFLFYLVFAQIISLGQLMTLFFYSFFIFGPLQQFGLVASSYQSFVASADLLDEVFSIPPVESKPDAMKVSSISSLQAQDVSFSYHDTNVLDSVSVSVSAGEVVSFAGLSGSGKSTLLKLLLGLYDPSSGSVIVNDSSLSSVDLSSYRQRIGLVTQSTQLFSASVRDNLLFVKPGASDEELISVLKQAQVWSVIQKSDDGLNTRIGEGGMKLSGGERQRLAIARALLRSPDILIFDEATSALDSRTEKAIMDTVSSIVSSRSDLGVIMIAHRLSTLTSSDRIYVLSEGRVSEVGSHSELLESNGLYSALWKMQSGF